MIDIEMGNKRGITLKTAGKYCKENITVTPKLKTINDVVTRNGNVEYSVEDGHSGIGAIKLIVDVPKADECPNAEEVAF